MRRDFTYFISVQTIFYRTSILLFVVILFLLISCQGTFKLYDTKERGLLADKDSIVFRHLGEQQSMAFYDNLALFINGNKCCIYDLNSLLQMASISLPCDVYKVPHSNTLCLGVKKYSSNSIVPAMYVSAWDGDKQAFVYDIVQNDGIFSASLIQVISPLHISEDIIGGGYLDWVVDANGGFLYSIAYHLKGTALNREGNYIHITAFELPPLADPLVNLQDEDVLYSFSVPIIAICQDKLYQDNHIFVVAGNSRYGDSYLPRLYDINLSNKKCMDTEIPIWGEPEGFCLYEGEKWINLYGSSIVYNIEYLINRKE